MHVPAGLGIDESVRSEHVAAGKANLTNKNVRSDKRGSLNKRNGFVAQTKNRLGGGSRAAGRVVFAHDKQACTIDGHTLDAYSSALATNVTVGRVPELAVERVPIASADDVTGPSALVGANDALSVAYVNGLYVIAATQMRSAGTDYRLNVYVVDASTRAVVKTFHDVPAANLVVPEEPKVCAVGNNVIVVWGSAANIRASRLDVTSAATIAAGFSAVSTLATNWNTADFAICALETSWVLVYTNTSATAAAITVTRYSTAFATITSSAAALSVVDTTSSAVAVDGSESDFIWVAWTDDLFTPLAVLVTGLNPANVAVVTSSTAAMAAAPIGYSVPGRLGIRRTSASGGYVVGSASEVATVGNYDMFARQFSNVAGTVTASTATQTTIAAFETYSRPFVLDGRVYAFGRVNNESAQSIGNLVAFDITSYTQGGVRPCASPARGLHAVGGAYVRNAREVVTVSATKVATVGFVKYNAADSAIEIFEVDAAATHQWQVARHNGCSYLSGGQVYAYDGEQLFESGFVHPPAITVADGAAGAIPDGTYIYTAIYEWSDAQGNVHWSEPAAPQTIALTGGPNRVLIYATGFTATWKQGVDVGGGAMPANNRLVQMKIFRTKVGGTGPFYLVTTVIPSTTATGLVYTDNATDAAIGANAKLYSQPGLLETALSRRSPPATVAIAEYQGTLVAIADDRKTVWLTGQRIVGEGAWWNDALQYPVGDGDLVALAEMDGLLYVWSRGGIFVASGEPPSDNGNAGGLGAFRRVTGEVGCIEPRSLVRTSLGVFFQSRRGIEILNRSGAVEWIGERVFATLDDHPVVTSAVYDPRGNVVIFSLASSESAGVAQGTSPRLVFDLSLREWISLDSCYGSGGTVASAQSAAVVWNGTDYGYAWLEPGGALNTETSSSGLDLGAYFVESQWEPSWFSVGLQQETQFWQTTLLFERVSAAGLRVEVAYDSADYAGGDDKTFTEAEIATYSKQVELRVRTRSQRFKLRVRDTAPATLGTGKGLTFIGASVDVGVKQGPTRATPRLAAGARK